LKHKELSVRPASSLLFVFILAVGILFFWKSEASAQAITVSSPTLWLQDCASCPPVAIIPKGTFKMGARLYDDKALKFEKPMTILTIDHHFAMGRFEVTRAEYGVCVDEGVCRPREKMADQAEAMMTHSQSPGHPVTGITWEDAQTYVEWLSKRTGEAYRLPTEAEWEYAARAGTETIYWWGDELGSSTTQGNQCSVLDLREPYPVGSFRANRFLLHDMLGNAGEWVADCWRPDLSEASQEAAEADDGECKSHVIRGLKSSGWALRSKASYRLAGKDSKRFDIVGFRVVREIPQDFTSTKITYH